MPERTEADVFLNAVCLIASTVGLTLAADLSLLISLVVDPSGPRPWVFASFTGATLGVASSRSVASGMAHAERADRVARVAWLLICSSLSASLAGALSPFAGVFAPAVALLASVLAVKSRLRSRIETHTLGSCLRCGYDMQGLPLPVCPECGNVELGRSG